MREDRELLHDSSLYFIVLRACLTIPLADVIIRLLQIFFQAVTECFLHTWR